MEDPTQEEVANLEEAVSAVSPRSCLREAASMASEVEQTGKKLGHHSHLPRNTGYTTKP